MKYLLVLLMPLIIFSCSDSNSTSEDIYYSEDLRDPGCFDSTVSADRETGVEPSQEDDILYRYD